MSELALHGGRPVRDQPFPSWPVSGPQELELIQQVLRSEHWGGGSELVSRFEELFAQLHNCEHGVAASSGSVALEMALQAAGINRGDEVIVPAHSFVATAGAVSRLGAVPVFVDIDSESYNLDCRKAAGAARAATKAIVAVHFGGVMADVDQLRHDARRLKLLLIEDAAHAHGAEWLGQRAGSFGDAGVFSFQNSKAMTAGEGGIVITNDSDIAEHARSLGNCGRRPGQGWFQHFELATNYRLSGLQAAVLLAQIERLGEQIRLREENRKALETMLPIPGLFFQKAPKGSNVNTLYLLTGRIDTDVFGMARDEFVEALNAEGIPCRRFYPHPLYRNPMFDSLPHRVEPCPVAENACKDSFWLPQRVLMGSEEDARDAGRAMEKIYQAVKPKARKTKQRRVNGAAH